MMRTMLLVPAFLSLCGLCLAQGGEVRELYVQVQAAKEGPTLPLSLRVDLTDASSIREGDVVRPDQKVGRIDPGAVQVLRASDGQATPILAQFRPDRDYDGEKRARGVVTWTVAPGEQPQSFVIRFGGPAAPPQPAEGLVVEESPERVVVRSATFEVVHARANGGLPVSIKFLPSGQTCDTLRLNDRVYDHGVQKGFWLRYDRQPKIEVVSRGPVEATIRVTARYCAGDGSPAPSGAQATYEFSYYAGSPLVRVTAQLEQKESKSWDELHFIELNLPDLSFPRWALGEPLQQGAFENSEKSLLGSSWGAFVSDQGVLALLGDARIYDGYKGYGNYLHGPWTTWSGTTAAFDRTLWLGPAEGALPQVAAAALALHRGLEVIVMTPSLRKLVAATEKRLSDFAAMMEKLPADRRATAAQGYNLAQWQWERLKASLHTGEHLSLVAVAGGQTEQMVGDLLGAAIRGQVPGSFSQIADSPLGGKELSLARGRLALAFHVADGDTRFASLRDLRSGLEFIAPGARRPLWVLHLAGPDRGAADVDSTRGQVTFERKGAEQLKLAWRGVPFPDQTTAQVTCTFDTGPAGELQADISIVSPSKTWSVYWVDFPIIPLGRLGESGEDDALAVPNGWGMELPAPLNRARGFGSRYPSGGWVMQFSAYYGNGAGLYLATHDGDAWTKDFAFEPADGALVYRVRNYPENAAKPHSPVGFGYRHQLALYDEGWYEASKIYRRWALQQKWCRGGPLQQRRDVPQWLKDLAIWARCGDKRESAVPPTEKFQDYIAQPIATHWYSWHVIPFDVSYPLYFPPKEGFKEGVKELQDHQVRVMPYINGRLWDSGNPSFAAEGKPHSAKDERGENYVEMYGSGAKLAPMCPATKFWQRRVADIVQRLVTEYNTDGVYIDQVGAAGPALCHDPSHGHPLVGGPHWVTGYRTMLADINARIRRVSPDKFLTTESNAEPYMDLFQAYLMCNSTGPDLIPMFSAVYSDRVLTFGRYVGGGDLARPPAYTTKIGQMFVFGAQLGWMDPDFLAKGREAEAAFTKRLAELRRAGQAYLCYGEMLRPLEPTAKPPEVKSDWRMWSQDPLWVTVPAVLHSLWRAPDGSVGVFLVNVTGESQHFAAPLAPKQYGLPEDGLAVQCTGDGAKLGQVEQSKGIVELDVSLEPLAGAMVTLRGRK